jgi:hypothetical protein
MPNSLVDLISEKAEALVGAPDGFHSLVEAGASTDRIKFVPDGAPIESKQRLAL